MTTEYDKPKSGARYDDDIESNVIEVSTDTFAGLRLAFIRKVYSVVALQIIVLFLMGTLFMTNGRLRTFAYTNIWFYWVTFGASIINIFVLMWLRKKSPHNFIALMTFTVLTGYSIAVITSTVALAVVIKSLVVCMTVVVGLTLFTFISKKDFSFLGAGLYASLWILVIASFLQLAFGFYGGFFETGMSIAGCVIFSLYILYDTHRLINTVEYDEWVVACVDIYLDIINLFIYILRLMARD